MKNNRNYEFEMEEQRMIESENEVGMNKLI